MNRLIVGCAVAFALGAAPLQASVSQGLSSATAEQDVQQARAQKVAAYLLPEGSYARMMKSTMDGALQASMGSMLDLPVREFVKAAGLSPEKAAQIDRATLRDIMQIVDPAYQERINVMMPLLASEMATLMTRFEPTARAAMANVYARRFSAAQLDDILRFFASPTGGLFAQNMMMMASDPAFMTEMQKIMPQIMQAMPAIMQKVDAAASGLPKPRRYEELTADERAQLARMLGVDPAALKH